MRKADKRSTPTLRLMARLARESETARRAARRARSRMAALDDRVISLEGEVARLHERSRAMERDHQVNIGHARARSEAWRKLLDGVVAAAQRHGYATMVDEGIVEWFDGILAARRQPESNASRVSAS